jgi:hypothetical protein
VSVTESRVRWDVRPEVSSNMWRTKLFYVTHKVRNWTAMNKTNGTMLKGRYHELIIHPWDILLLSGATAVPVTSGDVSTCRYCRSNRGTNAVCAPVELLKSQIRWLWRQIFVWRKTVLSSGFNTVHMLNCVLWTVVRELSNPTTKRNDEINFMSY